MNFTLDSTITPPTLHNNHVCLRRTKLSDLDTIKQYRQDPENCRYIRPAESDEETRSLVKQLSQPWQMSTGVWNGYSICLVDDESVLGEIVFRIEDWQCQRAEIGYRLHPKAAGKGICTQAAKLLIEHLFTHLGFFKLVAKCDVRNTASFNVMEKLGFKREAYFKDHYLMGNEWTDQLDYGLLASQWRTN